MRFYKRLHKIVFCCGLIAVQPLSASDGTIELRARSIPAPKLTSPEAQSGVARGAAILANRPVQSSLPTSIQDKEAWKRAIAASDAAYAPMLQGMRTQIAARIEKQSIAGVPVYVGTPNHPRKNRKNRIILHIHGGGFAMLADGNYAEVMAGQIATRCGCTVYSVNYRVPPDFPYPTAVDDSLAVYRALLKTNAPQNIAVQGESAGGNIAASMVLKARDAGLPMPAMAVFLSSAFDLTRSGDSHTVNDGLDLALGSSISSLIDLYAAGADLRSPYLSPVFADFSKGFPRTFLKAGGREILLSDSIAMHRALRRAGVEAELNIWEGMSHGSFGPPTALAPEDREVGTEIERFLDEQWR
ncbi:alpha/beta hydrolase [Caenibius sp. WL]|uniref:alpha/beta hydrolase n=1 Tax=Caenibius sp. WL TaxID=2872646 RepID=UPI001C994BDA|nr:alpha/beta hydrolase [Caenibius sp. WL]QZP08707.1 alpha/beta hydrolase [Caenibius sp. WL]